jgi:hypothetical protein
VNLEELDRVYETFCDFHAYFAPAFGRKQWREHSRHYLQALLVQSQERRNAENLAEMVPVSARAFQRFLTEAHWDDAAVIARLQEYLGPRLAHLLAVCVLDGSDFPKQGVKSVGVARQYCGELGKVANCQAGIFPSAQLRTGLAHVGTRGRALVDKRLYLPEGWASDRARCAAAGVPEAQREYLGENRPGPGDAAGSPRKGTPQRPVGHGRRCLRDVPGLPGWPGDRGDAVRPEGPAEHAGVTPGAHLEQPGLTGARDVLPGPSRCPKSARRWRSAVKHCPRRRGVR